jgi:hypothetical protein
VADSPIFKFLKPVLALTVGLVVAIYGFPLIFAGKQNGSSRVFKSAVIGEYKTVLGTVESKMPTELAFTPVRPGAALHVDEVILTHATSEAILKFERGPEIKLKEFSRMVVQNDASLEDGLVLTWLEGSIEMLAKEPLTGARTFRVFQNGKDVPLARINIDLIPVVKLGAEPSPSPAANIAATVAESLSAAPINSQAQPTPPRVLPPKISANVSETISNEEIVSRFKAQTGYFQRCFLTYLERKAKATTGAHSASTQQSGSVTVSFTIQTTGRISSSKIVRSDFQDVVLHSCVSEVIDRTIFRAFAGNAVPVNEFPILLE